MCTITLIIEYCNLFLFICLIFSRFLCYSGLEICIQHKQYDHNKIKELEKKMAIYLIDFENVHDSGLTGVTSLTDNDEIYIFYSSKSEHMSFDTHVNIMKTAAKVKYIKLRRSARNYLDFQLCTHLGFLIGAKVEGPYYIISKDTGYESVIDYWNDHGITIIRQPAVVFNHTQAKSQGQRAVTPPAIVTVQENSQIAADGPLPEVLPMIAIDQQLYIDQGNSSKPETDAGYTGGGITDSDAAADISSEEASAAPQASEPEKTAEEVTIKTQTLPESYRKKVRSVLKGKGIPSGKYSPIYKAILNSYDKLALNNLMVKTFGSSTGGVVYNQIKDIFTDYHSGK